MADFITTDFITDHIDIWTSAIKAKSAAGRGSSKKLDLYGIKKLRELILELAVRGKLVPQDPGDEPASQLLQRIAEEKAKFGKEGKIKKQKQLVADKENPFELADGWEWAQFGSLALHNAGKTLDKGRNKGELRDYITTSNLYWGRFKLTEVKQMPFLESDIEKCKATKFDLLICEGGEAGRAAVWDHDYDICFQNHVHRARFWSGISPYFVFRLFQKMDYTGEINNYRKGVAISNMSGKALSSIAVPVPPINEQHRIVAKIDELMALCDQLETQTEVSIDAHKTLVEVLLATLTNAKDAIELNDSWQRISQHFDVLFTTQASIDQLKQTILQLAVMGKLVKQDPKNEPAAKLLERIAAEKAQLIKDKKIKKHPKVDSTGPTITLPESWVEIVIQDFADIKLGSTPSRADLNYWNGDIPWVSSGEVVNSVIMDTREKITKSGFANSSAPIIPARSLLMAIIGQGKTRGQSALLGIDATTNQNVAAFVFNEAHVVPEFVWIWAKSKYEAHRGDGRGGAQPALNGKIVRSFKFPLPPYNEQRLIVAKVNELITLCDSLKASLKNAQTTQLHLTDAIVEQAL